VFLRQSIVTQFVVRCVTWCALIALPAAALPESAIPRDIDNLLKTVEGRYNHAQSLKLDFSETYIGTGRPAQTESGVLYLHKPGRMRWEYTLPAGKVFLSDGKEVIQYNPGDSQASRSKLKESEDMRAPLAFLLGKLEFAKEFKSFRTDVDPAGTWIIAEPKSENLAYSKVEFLAGSGGELHRVRVTGQDRSKLDFTSSNEQLNAPVSPSMFIFHPPAGVSVVQEGQ
jgi:outer membrane lipoprotein carrier protein